MTVDAANLTLPSTSAGAQLISYTAILQLKSGQFSYQVEQVGPEDVANTVNAVYHQQPQSIQYLQNINRLATISRYLCNCIRHPSLAAALDWQNHQVAIFNLIS